ncbi:hypothetical protein DXG01_001981 [Tephrocybe rancida]|nr:hypothetical protein DXG01_001981 [Tephrocybe rancida]
MGAPFVDKLEHVNFGKIHGMSTRKGEVKFLEDILDASRDAMSIQMMKNEEKAKEINGPSYISDQVGMMCVKIQDIAGETLILIRAIGYTLTTSIWSERLRSKATRVLTCNTPTFAFPPSLKAAPALVFRTDSSLIDTSLLVEPKAHELAFLLGDISRRGQDCTQDK